MLIHLKDAVVFFVLGVVQGMLLMDYLRQRNDLRALNGLERSLGAASPKTAPKASKSARKALGGVQVGDELAI